MLPITGTPSHRYGYRGGGAARDRAAAGAAEADAAGEAPGEPLAWPRAHQAALTPGKLHPCVAVPVATGVTGVTGTLPHRAGRCLLEDVKVVLRGLSQCSPGEVSAFAPADDA